MSNTKPLGSNQTLKTVFNEAKVALNVFSVDNSNENAAILSELEDFHADNSAENASQLNETQDFHSDNTAENAAQLAELQDFHSDNSAENQAILSELQSFHADNSAENDAQLAETQSFHSDTNTRLDTIITQTDGIEASLSSIDGKIANNYGVASGAVRTAAQVGNTTGQADFNAGTTGAQTLRTSSNITRNGTELSYNAGASDANTLRTASNLKREGIDLDYGFGTVGVNTLRTAAEIGNATGSADFNAGATGAQTLRTASNIYGNARTTAPTPISTGTVGQFSSDEYSRMMTLSPEGVNAAWGMMFGASTDRAALTGTTEAAFFYFKNPTGSGKSAKLFSMSFGPTLGNNYVTYRVYLDPTVTSDGTPVSIVGRRQTGQASTVVSLFTIPTVSANGTLFETIVCSGLSGNMFSSLYKFDLWIEANHSILVTRHLSSNATIGGVNVVWAEQ